MILARTLPESELAKEVQEAALCTAEDTIWETAA